MELPTLVLQQSEIRTSGASLRPQELFFDVSLRDATTSRLLFAVTRFRIPAEATRVLFMPQKKMQLPVVLSIAGHDPSSGAGITADIKTIAAHGCYGVTCITALTVQSTRGVKRIDPVEGRIITETLEQLMDDLKIAAIKIGMLGSEEAAKAVAAFLKRYPLRHVVLDPIVRSSSGAELISRDGLQVMKDRIIGRASVITPNIDEAAALTGLTVTTLDEMQTAALRLHDMGARNVIITGGHLDPPNDLVSAEVGQAIVLHGKKIPGHSTHGTGCAFSTALACNLALGQDLLTAAKAAKHFVETALSRTPAIGKGIGPVI
ncbi:MAG TPA: bifunctional hydroxymethylpyrimidine kinase/phosphomethylpyrimidine kinase [Candidatus Angelobacter sp.]|jgi:hydroxymethylpyrimidine/phosphomethylpyrimidine kinase|nr:bifunctional hydroxymethylpyrimidine kinase/phosphomethylpyrimidine kinase [Candidatus Angelobacter sp.]